MWASTHSGLGGRETVPQDPSSRAYPPNPLVIPPYSITTHHRCTGAATLHEQPGCVCQLSDRKRPRPDSPESAIYLCFVPCQWFMPWGSEIRLSWCWCYAACFAQKTPRGHTELVAR